MPASIDPSAVTGYTAFALVKFLGYGFTISRLRTRYIEDPAAWPGFLDPARGAFRTALGMVLGLAYYFLWATFVGESTLPLAYLVGLLPVRWFEWWVTARVVCRKECESPGFERRMIVVGTVASYLLDLPATFGFLVTGGLAIC